MKRGLIACVFSTLLLAQKIQQKPNEPPPQASFGLQDSSVIQRLPESKPDAKLTGPIPRLANGQPDLSGPWQPNAIREKRQPDCGRGQDSIPAERESDL